MQPGPGPGDVSAPGPRRGKTGPAPVSRAPSVWPHAASLPAPAPPPARHPRHHRSPSRTLAPDAPSVSTDTLLFLLYLLLRQPFSTLCMEVTSYAGFTSGPPLDGCRARRCSSFTFYIELASYCFVRPRFLVSVVRSVATLAHRAMQRGPCKSRVTVTSAHAVLVPLQ